MNNPQGIGSDDREAMVRVRLDQSAETLTLAKELLEQHRNFQTVVNRAYYAGFYYLSGVLMHHKASFKSHKGAQAILNQEFVMKGRIDKEAHSLIQRLYINRLENDYERFAKITESEAQTAVANAEKFINLIKPLLA